MTTDSTTIVTTATGRVEGFRHRGLYHFHGIPYAAPPVGAARFAPAVAHPGWSGTLDATRFGESSPQSPPTDPLPEGYDPSEDCLNLNVISPNLEVADLPVLVWIHGGAFVGGSARMDNAGIGRLRGLKRPVSPGARRVARNGPAVVVSINYRLGALGWLHLEHLDDSFAASGNAGLTDQMQALRWVRENVAQFGGDPARITVVGQSAGAMATATMLSVPGALDGVAGAVLMSGAAETVRSTERAVEITERVMEFLKVDDPHRLRELPPAELVRAQGAVWWKLRLEERANIREDTHLFLGPTIDATVVREPPLGVIARGDSPDIPLLVGSNLDELRVPFVMAGKKPVLERDEMVRRMAAHPALADRAEDVISFYLQGDTDPVEAWDTFRSDWLYRLPAARLAATRDHHYEAPAYRYLFAHRGRGNGAAHAAQLRHVFNNSATQSPTVRGMARDMHQALLSFLRSGNPSHDGLPPWFPFREKRVTMWFDGVRALVENPDLALDRVFGDGKDGGGGESDQNERQRLEHG